MTVSCSALNVDRRFPFQWIVVSTLDRTGNYIFDMAKVGDQANTNNGGRKI
jgi:hypothetical protein